MILPWRAGGKWGALTLQLRLRTELIFVDWWVSDWWSSSSGGGPDFSWVVMQGGLVYLWWCLWSWNTNKFFTSLTHVLEDKVGGIADLGLLLHLVDDEVNENREWHLFIIHILFVFAFVDRVNIALFPFLVLLALVRFWFWLTLFA